MPAGSSTVNENGAKVCPSDVVAKPVVTTAPAASSTRQGTLASNAAASPDTSTGDGAVAPSTGTAICPS